MRKCLALAYVRTEESVKRGASPSWAVVIQKESDLVTFREIPFCAPSSKNFNFEKTNKSMKEQTYHVSWFNQNFKQTNVIADFNL